MESTKTLTAYEIEFCPIVRGITRPLRNVRIVAYSPLQARKFFIDWRKHRCHVPYLYVATYEVEKPKELTLHEWQKEIREHFKKQQDIIYRKES